MEWLSENYVVLNANKYHYMCLGKNTEISKFYFEGNTFVKDTHREKTPSNKSPELTKSMNMNIWVVGTSNALSIKGSYSEEKFSKNKEVTGKPPFFVIGPFCTSHSICLNTSFWQGSFVWKCCVFNRSTFN